MNDSSDDAATERADTRVLLEVPATPKGLSVLSLVLHWSHPRGTAHCLARLVVGTGRNRPTIVLSELRTNPTPVSLGLDPAGAATALRARPETETTSAGAGDVVWDDARWLLHYGEFSDYYTDEPETFTEVDLHWDGHGYQDPGLETHRLLSPVEAGQLTRTSALRPVDDLLADLQRPS